MSLLGAGSADEAVRLVRSALDAGITLVDTADVYADGAVEELLGTALRGRREEVTLATKVGLPMGGDPERSGGSRRWIVEAVEGSLRRLQTDRIDLYQLHRLDPLTPIEETVAAFEELRAAGKIVCAGSSVFPAESMVDAAWAAERLGAARWISEQPPYSILVRGIERSVLPTARRLGQGVVAWSPLNGGWLTGKYRRDVAPPEGSRAALGNPFVRVDDELKLRAVDALRAVADQAGLSLLEMSLSWPLVHPDVSSVLIGPRTRDQLAELLAASGHQLDDATLNAIDEIVAPGTNLDPRNAGWVSPGLDVGRRRTARPASR